MSIRKKDSVWLYSMLDEILQPGLGLFLYRKQDGSISVSLNHMQVLKRTGSKKATGKTIKEAIRGLYDYDTKKQDSRHPNV